MNLKDLLKKHEGLRLRPYKCSRGKLTIGVGRNLDDNGISLLEAEILLDHDIALICKQAKESFPWFMKLSEVRKDVVLSMIFNMGLHGVMGFKRTLSAIATRDFELASKEMMASEWAAQVGRRAYELSEMMRTDAYFEG